MSEPKLFPPVKVIASMIYSDTTVCKRSREAIAERLGQEDFASQDLPFDRTHYYEKEMGPGLRRIFVSYANPVDRESLIAIKLYAHQVETTFSSEGRRRVNIDPGYISLENLVLATFKGYSHRIYLGQGVFAEVTLIFEKGSFRPLQWTYPDYVSVEVIGIMNKIRARYRDQLKNVSPSPFILSPLEGERGG